jgi:hypothetical protein
MLRLLIYARDGWFVDMICGRALNSVRPRHSSASAISVGRDGETRWEAGVNSTGWQASRKST